MNERKNVFEVLLNLSKLLVIFFSQQIYAKYKAAMKELSNLFYTEF